jgi:nucleoside-diphosphate-sugar epimerase
MKIHILGGAGLVGNGIKKVLELDYDVRVFSSDCFDFDLFRFVDSRIFDCDVFIHAAGIRDEDLSMGAEFCIKKSTEFINLIISGLDKYHCSKLVYVSSIHVFGDLNVPIDPNRIPNPRSYYAFYHYCAEKTFELQVGLMENKLDFFVLRVPTIYGFQANKSRINRPGIIQNSFIVSLFREGMITLKTNGEQYRLFSSNFKVGQVIGKWIRDDNRSRLVYDTVDGINMTVFEFATLCQRRMSDFNSQSEFKIETGISFSKNDVFMPIVVSSRYDLEDSYLLEDFVDDFIRNYNNC